MVATKIHDCIDDIQFLTNVYLDVPYMQGVVYNLNTGSCMHGIFVYWPHATLFIPSYIFHLEVSFYQSSVHLYNAPFYAIGFFTYKWKFSGMHIYTIKESCDSAVFAFTIHRVQRSEYYIEFSYWTRSRLCREKTRRLLFIYMRIHVDSFHFCPF